VDTAAAAVPTLVMTQKSPDPAIERILIKSALRGALFSTIMGTTY